MKKRKIQMNEIKIGSNDIVSVHIDRIISFLMIWHPRLGKKCPMRKYANKDVAKLIAKKFMTIPRQLLFDSSVIIIKPKQLIDLKWMFYKARDSINGIPEIWKARYVDRSRVGRSLPKKSLYDRSVTCTIECLSSRPKNLLIGV